MPSPPIEDYALLSDRHGSALVDRARSVDWLCLPRFDSPSIFGSLLDPDSGHWAIRPVAPATVTRRYVDRTMAVETTFTTPDGTMTLADCLALGSDDDPHQLGRDAPSLLTRVLRCESGTVDVDFDFQPRPEYGLVTPFFTAVGVEWSPAADLSRSCFRARGTWKRSTTGPEDDSCCGGVTLPMSHCRSRRSRRCLRR